jgi:two-component system OmpR family sensor kinase
MRIGRRSSLKARLALLTGVGAIALLSLGSLLLYRNLEGEISAAITAELRLRTNDISSVFVQNGNDDSLTVPIVAQVIGTSGQVLAPLGQAPLLTPDEIIAADSGEQIMDRAVPGIGEHARVLARAIDTPRGHVVVVAATTTQPLEASRTHLLVVIGIAGPLFAFGLTIVAWLLADAALRPVRRMTREAASISLSETGRRLGEPAGRDEIAALGRTLNQMLERIESTVARERAFIDDASHELRTPLAVLRGELELAAQRPDDAEAVQVGLASALEETDRIVHLAEDLLTLARVDAGQVAVGVHETDLLVAANDAVQRLTRGQVRVDVVGVATRVHGEQRLIEQIITNLVVNATRHARSQVTVSVRREGTRSVLAVADDGAGFAPALLPRAAERFTRGDASRGRTGTGLGLAIASALANALGGAVEIMNDGPLGGALVNVSLRSTAEG